MIQKGLKWYRLANDGTGVERYVRSVQGQESVKLLFRLRTDSAGLLEDKKRWEMISDERCVMRDSRVGEDVADFLAGCGKLATDGLVLLDDVCRFWRVEEEGKVALLFGKKGWRAYVTE